MFNKILFPLDRSREAQEAIAVAIDLVQKYQSQLILLSVIETPDLNAEVIDDDPVMQSPDAIDQLLHSAQALFAKRGIQSEILQREGKPAFTICDVADELNVDLIVMGSHGIGLDVEHTAESVTSRVINLSPCPVLIVP
jgi:nucleotide-binding universal stress UspA family protein